MKIFISIFIIIFLSQCGYKSVYENIEKRDLKIVSQKIDGDKSIGSLVRTELKKNSKEQSKNLYIIDAKTNYSKSVISKDKTGKATDLKLSVKINFTVKFNDTIKNYIFEETLNIENSLDTYEQRNYENNLKRNFVSSIVDKLVLKLVNLE